jgi:hypothetical protein
MPQVAIVKYSKSAVARMKEADAVYRGIFSHLDDLMLENIARILAKNKGEKLRIKAIDQIYKSDEWDKVQRSMDRYQSSALKEMKSIYKAEIDAMKEIYPKSEFKMGDLQSSFSQMEQMATETTGDMLRSIIGTKDSAKAYLRATQLNLFLNSKERIYEYLEKTVKSAANRNIITELATAQNNLYNKMRVDFFKQVKTKNIKRFIYAGVADGKNRPVCSRYIGKINTEAGWRKISNHQNGSIWDNRGGYNCRHFFLLVSEAWTEKQQARVVDAFGRQE